MSYTPVVIGAPGHHARNCNGVAFAITTGNAAAAPSSRKCLIAKRASNSPLNGQQKPIVMPASSAKPASICALIAAFIWRRRMASSAIALRNQLRALFACATP